MRAASLSAYTNPGLRTHPIEPLIQIVNAALADATTRSGTWLACRPGCSQCCHGTFPISALDADRLQQGLDLLTRSNPDRARSVRQRANAAISLLHPTFPADLTTGHLLETEAAIEAFDDLDDEQPCPALDPATQTCDLYAARPILCRTFGPPLRVEVQGFATCELCFIGASPEEVERCQLDPNLPSLEDQANELYAQTTGKRHTTTVALALAQSSPRLAQPPTPIL